MIKLELMPKIVTENLKKYSMICFKLIIIILYFLMWAFIITSNITNSKMNIGYEVLIKEKE